METSKSSESTTDYPEPLFVPPLLAHKHTVVILQGRGSNFDLSFLSTQLPDGQTFQAAFPQAEFIFPTASKRHAQMYNRSIIHQWFDNESLSTPTERESLMTERLRDSSSFLHGLPTKAIQEVGAKIVALDGLSQGCAAMLIALLTWRGEPLGAGFGTCGWLPL